MLLYTMHVSTCLKFPSACVPALLLLTHTHFHLDVLHLDTPTPASASNRVECHAMQLALTFWHRAWLVPCDCVVQFLRLGFDGYKKIMMNLMEVAAHLAKGILDTGMSTISSPMSPLGCSDNNRLYVAVPRSSCFSLLLRRFDCSQIVLAAHAYP